MHVLLVFESITTPAQSGAIREGILSNPEAALILATSTVGFVLGLFLLFRGITAYRRYTLVRDTVTESLQAAALGRTELQGVVRPAEEVIGQPVTDGECVYAEWRIEGDELPADEADGEFELEQDGDGNWELVDQQDDDPGEESVYAKAPRPGFITHMGDKLLIDQGSVGTPFYLEDETGRVLVADPADATVLLSDNHVSAKRTPYVGSTDDHAIHSFCAQRSLSLAGPLRSRVYRQAVLEPDTEVYVFGQAVSNAEVAGPVDAAELAIRRDDGSDQFIISDRSATELQSEHRWRAGTWLIGGLALVVLGFGAAAVFARSFDPAVAGSVVLVAGLLALGIETASLLAGGQGSPGPTTLGQLDTIERPDSHNVTVEDGDYYCAECGAEVALIDWECPECGQSIRD